MAICEWPVFEANLASDIQDVEMLSEQPMPGVRCQWAAAAHGPTFAERYGRSRATLLRLSRTHLQPIPLSVAPVHRHTPPVRYPRLSPPVGDRRPDRRRALARVCRHRHLCL